MPKTSHKTCVVPVCPFDCEEPFHMFPRNQERREAWRRACRMKYIPSNWSVVCGFHFKEEDYEKNLMHQLMGVKRKYRLKEDAVPSLFTNIDPYKKSSATSITVKQEQVWPDEVKAKSPDAKLMIKVEPKSLSDQPAEKVCQKSEESHEHSDTTAELLTSDENESTSTTSEAVSPTSKSVGIQVCKQPKSRTVSTQTQGLIMAFNASSILKRKMCSCNHC